MAEKSKANTKGVQLNLDKTFKKGLLEGMNVDFSGFFGETDEKGANRKKVLTFDGKTYQDGLPDIKYQQGEIIN